MIRPWSGQALMGIAGAPVQVCNPEGAGISTTAGPYLSSALSIAGLGLIEADDLDAAVALAAQSPCAVAHEVIEVWPLEEAPPAG